MTAPPGRTRPTLDPAGRTDTPAAWPTDGSPEAVVLDLVARTVTVHTPSGPRSARLPGPPTEGEIVRGTWHPGRHECVLRTRDGHDLTSELPGGRGHDGRPVVYLDQNVWSALSAALHRPDDLPPAVADAGRRLARLADDGQVLLPLASAHILETTRWSTRPQDRRDLALTLLRLSRGWRVRHPLRVRADELAGPLGLHVAPRPTVGVGVALFDVDGPDPSQRGEAAVMSEEVTLAETLLDADPVPREPPTPWAQDLRRFADNLPPDGSPGASRRSLVDGRVWQDLLQDIVRTATAGGMTADQVARWAGEHWPDGCADLPATGLFAELVFDRLVNTGSKWHDNDLVDMTALSTGAGYADHVVTENHMGTVLGQGVRRLGRRVQVHAGLVAGVKVIERR